MSVSIREVADSFQKNTRTVRRWCAKGGLVPGAYQTKGGHWRLSEWNIRVRDSVKANIEGFARERNAFQARFRRRRSAYTRKAVSPLSPDDLRTRYSLIAEGWTKDEVVARIEKLDAPSPEFEAAIKGTPVDKPDSDQAERAAEERLKETALFLATKELAMQGDKPTVARLCLKLEISRATFHRRYPKEIRKSAVAESGVVPAASVANDEIASYLKEQAESLPAKPTKNL